MKKAYDAASAFTTILSIMLDKSVPYEYFEEMNQDMLRWVNLTIEENPTGDSDTNSSDNSSSEDEAPPPKKKWKSSFKSVLKTCGEESVNDNDDIEKVMDTDGEEEEGGRRQQIKGINVIGIKINWFRKKSSETVLCPIYGV
jgi:hypothetical protein